MNEPKVGDRIQIHNYHEYWSFHPRTPLWMGGSYATIIRLNKQTVTIVLDAYPDEKHRIDYGVFDILNEEESI